MLERWEPFRELRRMEDRMDRLFKGWPRRVWDEEFEGWALPLDVVEEEDKILVKATVPGIKPEDIDVTVDDDRLVIKGETREEREEREENYLMRERKMGKFYRAIHLPHMVDPEKAETRYEHGVLTVTFPKVEEKKAKRLEIKAG